MELNEIKSSSLNWGEAASSLNQNFSKIGSDMEKMKYATTRNKGYFSSGDALKSTVESAVLGDIAYVKSEVYTPYELWEWTSSGWVASGKSGGNESVNLGDYYTKEDTDKKLSDTSEEISVLRTETDAKLSELGSKHYIFNVNHEIDDTTYTLAEAIAAVPTDIRKIGMFVTYKEKAGTWRFAQYRYGNPTSPASWENTDGWILYSTKDELENYHYIFNVNNEISDNTYTLTEARNAVPLDYRRKGLIITYRVGANAWRTEQFNYDTPTSQYWASDSLWNVIEKGTDKTLKIAAYDSSDLAKASADLISTDENGGISLINYAISEIGNDGGKIFLFNGTYKGDQGVALVNSNITIEGESIKANIQRTSGYDIFTNDNTISGVIIRGISFNMYLIANGAEVYFDSCKITGNINSLNTKRKVVRVPVSQGIDGINAAINTMTLTYGGVILLDEGVYEGDTYINFVNRGYNITISGLGRGTIIKRNTEGNDVIIPDQAQGIIIENLTLNTGFNKYPNREPVRHCRFNNVYVGNKYINDAPEEKINIINVGEGYYFSNLSSVCSILNSGIRIYPYNGVDYRWEIHVYGRIVETEALSIGYPNVDLIGHNAIVEFKGDKGVHATFTSSGVDSPDIIGRTVKIKNVKFLKTGCYPYWDEGCVVVTANGYKFENCIFENRSSSPAPFNQADNENITDTTTGARRHGIVIDIFDTDNRYATEFYNCVGIGSPYGFQNTRGWYISFGSPKLFNCIGIGGGIGLYGHGIIMHRGSTPELFNCVGYGSKWGYNDNAGIRFQAMGQGTLIGCTGYGSNAQRYKSLGVSAERLAEVTVDGVVDYSKLTNDDVTIQPTGIAGGKGVGISFWANNGSAKLINCVGYAGNGQYSAGLELNADAKPIINGGYYGVEDKTYNFQWDKSKLYNTLNIDKFTPLLITNIVVSIVGNFDGLTLHVVTNDSNGFDVADINLTGVASIGMLNIKNGDIGVNTELAFYFTDSKNQTVQPPSSPYFHVGYCFNNHTRGISLLESSSPNIRGSVIKTDSIGESVFIDTDSSNYNIEQCLLDTYGGVGIATERNNIRMYDCCIKGAVDNKVVFANKTSINSSSNYFSLLSRKV